MGATLRAASGSAVARADRVEAVFAGEVKTRSYDVENET